jgi:4-amino-4-deoxy-L-arabinose transferase-like glycosyltransferase
MPLAERIQWLIHKLEVGAGSRYLRILALVLGVVALAFVYDLRAYRNLATPEAMDAAQLARNISEGRGYTTEFIRPFSLYLVQSHNASQTSALSTNLPDFAQTKTAHPDLANAPVYPILLAGLMKTVKFQYPVNLKKPFWTNNGTFWRYQPDFLIAIFNEFFFILVVVLTIFLAKKLFDSNVAWLSAILTLGCELLWRFSASGLSTMLLLVIFLGLTLLLLEIERSARETQLRAGRLIGLAVAVGILTGIGALTRYAFGWTIIPAGLFLLFFSGPRGPVHVLAALAAFALVLAPWIVRNEAVSGTPFGTAGYAIVEGTFVFPKFQLERSVHPELTHAMWLTPYAQKLFGNLREILTGDLLKTLGTCAGALFFAGLFMGFRSTGARRVRYFLLMCLSVFIVVQSLGRTELSNLSPEINSENLLVLLVPLVLVFGSGFFFTLLEQMTLPLPQLRYAVVGLFVTLCCLPLAFVLLPPRSTPVVYPPYYPPMIQQTAAWMKPAELMMSDVPWAVAWYGDRPCVWLTLDWQDNFKAINKNLQPVQALYLTPQTMDGKYVSEWMEGSERSWGGFLLQTLNDKRVPDQFPLTKAPAGFFPDQLFLTDRDRWTIPK